MVGPHDAHRQSLLGVIVGQAAGLLHELAARRNDDDHLGRRVGVEVLVVDATHHLGRRKSGGSVEGHITTRGVGKAEAQAIPVEGGGYLFHLVTSLTDAPDTGIGVGTFEQELAVAGEVMREDQELGIETQRAVVVQADIV